MTHVKGSVLRLLNRTYLKVNPSEHGASIQCWNEGHTTFQFEIHLRRGDVDLLIEELRESGTFFQEEELQAR